MERPETRVEVTCGICKTTHKLTVPIEGFIKWRSGVLIQQALPELSADDRELLISGVCGGCFDDMFKEEE